MPEQFQEAIKNLARWGQYAMAWGVLIIVAVSLLLFVKEILHQMLFGAARGLGRSRRKRRDGELKAIW